MDLIQSATFKTLVGFVVSLVCGALARKLGWVDLNVAEISAATVAVVAFIFGRQWKQVALVNSGSLPAPTTGAAAASAATAPVKS